MRRETEAALPHVSLRVAGRWHAGSNASAPYRSRAQRLRSSRPNSTPSDRVQQISSRSGGLLMSTRQTSESASASLSQAIQCLDSDPGTPCTTVSCIAHLIPAPLFTQRFRGAIGPIPEVLLGASLWRKRRAPQEMLQVAGVCPQIVMMEWLEAGGACCPPPPRRDPAPPACPRCGESPPRAAVAASADLPSPHAYRAHLGPRPRVRARVGLYPPILPGQIDRPRRLTLAVGQLGLAAGTARRRLGRAAPAGGAGPAGEHRDRSGPKGPDRDL